MGKEALAHSYLRFSSKRQERGDSVRRQTTLGDAWLAKMPGLRWSDLVLRDLGVSAFKGANLTRDLGRFIALAREGVEVRPGDYFVIEQVDRLSRQAAYQALPLVTELVDLGIRIVDLDLGGTVKIIDRDYLTTNQWALIELVLKFANAHEHSKKLSMRVLEARGAAMTALRTTGAKIRQRLPAWIRKGEAGFEFIPERAAAMRRMIGLAMSGMGRVSITATLNREGVPPVSDRHCTKNWEDSTVGFYLRSRLLVGEYQPTEVAADGKRVPSGAPLVGYYPALLSEEEFLKLQAILDTRARVKGRGREGESVANLFGKLLVNGFDGGTMTLVQKRSENLNLLSMNAKRGIAEPCSFPYPAFERAFLRWVAEIDVSSRRSTTSTKLDERLARLSTLTKKSEILSSKMNATDDLTLYETIADQMMNLERERAALKSEIHAAKVEAAAPHVSTGEVVSLAEQLRQAKGDELKALRSRLRLAIATVVDRIDLFPCVGGSALIRHAGAVVTLRNGLVRAYQIRVERGREPVTTVWCGEGMTHNPSSPDFARDLCWPHAVPADFDALADYRKQVGELSKELATATYDVFVKMARTIGGTAVAIPWG